MSGCVLPYAKTKQVKFEHRSGLWLFNLHSAYLYINYFMLSFCYATGFHKYWHRSTLRMEGPRPTEQLFTVPSAHIWPDEKLASTQWGKTAKEVILSFVLDTSSHVKLVLQSSDINWLLATLLHSNGEWSSWWTNRNRSLASLLINASGKSQLHGGWGASDPQQQQKTQTRQTEQSEVTVTTAHTRWPVTHTTAHLSRAGIWATRSASRSETGHKSVASSGQPWQVWETTRERQTATLNLARHKRLARLGLTQLYGNIWWMYLFARSNNTVAPVYIWTLFLSRLLSENRMNLT